MHTCLHDAWSLALLCRAAGYAVLHASHSAATHPIDQSWRVRPGSSPMLERAMHGLLCMHQLRGCHVSGVERVFDSVALCRAQYVEAQDRCVWVSHNALQKSLHPCSWASGHGHCVVEAFSELCVINALPSIGCRTGYQGAKHHMCHNTRYYHTGCDAFSSALSGWLHICALSESYVAPKRCRPTWRCLTMRSAVSCEKRSEQYVRVPDSSSLISARVRTTSTCAPGLSSCITPPQTVSKSIHVRTCSASR